MYLLFSSSYLELIQTSKPLRMISQYRAVSYNTNIMITLGFLIGIIGGFMGIFYRTCLKAKNMIFNFWYDILSKMVSKGGILKFIAYPLGYCIYCSTTWITFILCFVQLSIIEGIIWQDAVIMISAASGMQHVIVAMACRFLISGHPDIS